MNVGFGIDLGTTRTSIGMVAPDLPERGWYGNAQVIPLSDGPMTPSVVLFEKDTHIVGTAAKNQGHLAQDCVQLFKREMSNADWRFKPPARPGKAFSPQDLSALLLKHVAESAASMTGLNVRDVVVTVPAYFGEPERRRTRAAAEQADLTVLDIINEPTAAILSHLFQPGVSLDDASVLVFDLGGGTFDTVVVEVSDNSVTVASIDGDLLLGGRDFDSTIALALAAKFQEQFPDADLPTAEISARARLMQFVENSRESLSYTERSNIPVWGSGESAGLSMNVELRRQEMESLVEKLIDGCIRIAERARDNAKTEGAVPTKVLFVGGMTRTPSIRNRVLEELGLEELKVGADPDLAVTKGAAIWAQKLLLQKELLANLGLKTMAEVDWDAADVQTQIRDFKTRMGFERAMVTRLLQLDVRSITSRGYAIGCYSPSRDLHYLHYLVNAGDRLAFRSEPGSYIWNNEVSSWNLELYEDRPDKRGSTDPKDARLVETIRSAMVTKRAAGSDFMVVLEMGLDQIIKVEAWHSDIHGDEDRVEVEITPH
ncbi:Hsp70 family protein [Nocardia salmonicida]|uniref:Hsp70 family protein n=1 Tax=Nocardia salmonicida TaxID=53431 RepID=UPI0007A414A0|nr:Hsp70 family protein [Nocardia salmonicida]